MAQMDEQRKLLLRRTAPLSNNPNISFQDYRHGRIVIEKGIRMLDWEKDNWVPYIKDGVRWVSDEYVENDYIVLENALSSQLDKTEG